MALVSIRSKPREAGPRLRRDTVTFTLYITFASWGWFLYAYSPSVPLLADDQGISDALAGLHGTSMAAGGLLAAALTPRAVLWWGRRATIVGGCLALAGTIGAFLLGPSLPWTLAAVFLVSVTGNVMFSSTQVGLALHHGPAATVVITEGNGLGSAVGLLAPLTVGATVGLGWGWRPALLVSCAGLVVAAVLISRLPATDVFTARPRRASPVSSPVPSPAGLVVSDGATAPPGEVDAVTRPGAVDAAAMAAPRWRPGTAAWLFFGALVATSGVEAGMAYWSARLLAESTGAGPGIATAALAGMLVGMSVMRFVVGPLALRYNPTKLLALTFGLCVVGWAVMWTASTTVVGFGGLVVAGLGIGAQYPLAVSLLLAASDGHTDRAQGYALMGGAAATAVSPFLLGALSDGFGMHTAFVVVPVFALAGGVCAYWGGQVLRRAEVAAREPVAA